MEGGHAPRVHAQLGVHSWNVAAPAVNVVQTPNQTERRGVLPWPAPASRLTFTPPPRSFPWPLGTPVSPVVVNGVLVHSPASSPEADSPNSLTRRQVVCAVARQSAPLTPSNLIARAGTFTSQAPIVVGPGGPAKTVIRGVPAQLSQHEVEVSNSTSSWIRSPVRSSSPVTDSPVSPGQELQDQAYASPRGFDCHPQVAALRSCELKGQRRPSPLCSHNQQVKASEDSEMVASPMSVAEEGGKEEGNLRPHLYQNYPTRGIYA